MKEEYPQGYDQFVGVWKWQSYELFSDSDILPAEPLPAFLEMTIEFRENGKVRIKRSNALTRNSIVHDILIEEEDNNQLMLYGCCQLFSHYNESTESFCKPFRLDRNSDILFVDDLGLISQKEEAADRYYFTRE